MPSNQPRRYRLLSLFEEAPSLGEMVRTITGWTRDHLPGHEPPAPPLALPPMRKNNVVLYSIIPDSTRQRILRENWRERPDTAWRRLDHEQKVKVLRSILARNKGTVDPS